MIEMIMYQLVIEGGGNYFPIVLDDGIDEMSLMGYLDDVHKRISMEIKFCSIKDLDE